MTRQELCAALDAQLAAAQEQVCVLAVPLAGGVPLYERGAGRRAVSASTIKVFILLAALDEVRRGRLALDTPVASQRKTFFLTQASLWTVPACIRWRSCLCG